MTVIYLSMGIAFLIGFLLSVYFFSYRSNINKLWRWLGTILGGVIVGSFMAVVVLMILWPPVEVWATVVGLVLIGIVTAAILAVSRTSGKAGKKV